MRLQLHALAYNLGNFLRTLALPEGVEHWSLTTLREKLIKIGAKVVRHGRYITFQMEEVAIPRTLFAEILRLVDGLGWPNRPDKGRNLTYRAGSRREVWCERLSCYHRRQLAGAIWGISA